MGDVISLRLDDKNPLHIGHGKVHAETQADIEKKLSERFEVLELLTEACIAGVARSLIISGPAGLGKSFTVEKALKANDPDLDNSLISHGHVTRPSLVKLCHRYRAPGQVLVFDDCDSVFQDESSIKILKAACDTTETRIITYDRENRQMVDEVTDEDVPARFVYEGSVIFITNYDFDAMITNQHRFASHFEALVSRSHYIDMAMKTRADYIVRINQVIRQGLLNFCNATEKRDVIRFIEENQHSMRELTLRSALKVANLRQTNKTDWERIAKITCLKS